MKRWGKAYSGLPHALVVVGSEEWFCGGRAWGWEEKEGRKEGKGKEGRQAASAPTYHRPSAEGREER